MEPSLHKLALVSKREKRNFLSISVPLSKICTTLSKIVTYYYTYFAPSGNTITPKPEHNPFWNAPSYRVPSGRINKPAPCFNPLRFQSPIYFVLSSYLYAPFFTTPINAHMRVSHAQIEFERISFEKTFNRVKNARKNIFRYLIVTLIKEQY